jgi:aminoglycoside phosphotransferase
VAIDTGMSEARVWRLDIDLVKPRYIKIAQGQARGQLRREIKRTRWLAVRHVRVPTILRIHEDTGFMALLSDAVPGVVATRADFSPAALAAAIGFVDCGHCGKADRYLDLAIAAQEIAENFGGNEAQIFVKTYGEMTWDTKKARFFSNLYELF